MSSKKDVKGHTEENEEESESIWRDRILIVILPVIHILGNFNGMAMAGLVPLMQQYFNVSDSALAFSKTLNDALHVFVLTSVWLFGDFLPKKTTLLCAVVLWIACSVAIVFVNAHQYWLFVILEAFSSVGAGVVRVILVVIQADHFKGNRLANSITANVVGDSIIAMMANPITAIMVSNQVNFQIGLIAAPAICIPFVVLSAIFIRKIPRKQITNAWLLLKNAAGVLKVKSYSLLIAAQSTAAFYSTPLIFWQSSRILNAVEGYPDAFLGLSYAVSTSLITYSSAGAMLIGAALAPFLTRSLESGSGACACFPPTLLAVPIVLAASGILEPLTHLGQILLLPNSLPLTTVCFAFDSIASMGVNLMQTQLILSTTPSHQHASALSLIRLMIIAFNTPSSQLFGAISDYFRGDSTTAADRFDGLQKTFLYTWPISLVSMILYCSIMKFYRYDAEKAIETNRRESIVTAPLLSRKTTIRSYLE